MFSKLCLFERKMFEMRNSVSEWNSAHICCLLMDFKDRRITLHFIFIYHLTETPLISLSGRGPFIPSRRQHCQVRHSEGHADLQPRRVPRGLLITADNTHYLPSTDIIMETTTSESKEKTEQTSDMIPNDVFHIFILIS